MEPEFQQNFLKEVICICGRTRPIARKDKVVEKRFKSTTTSYALEIRAEHLVAPLNNERNFLIIPRHANVNSIFKKLYLPEIVMRIVFLSPASTRMQPLFLHFSFWHSLGRYIGRGIPKF